MRFAISKHEPLQNMKNDFGEVLLLGKLQIVSCKTDRLWRKDIFSYVVGQQSVK